MRSIHVVRMFLKRRMKKYNNYYIVSLVQHELKVSAFGGIHSIKMVWFDGQVGASAVFSNKKKAMKYAKLFGADIIECSYVKSI